jgi:hypothetical protein
MLWLGHWDLHDLGLVTERGDLQVKRLVWHGSRIVTLPR